MRLSPSEVTEKVINISNALGKVTMEVISYDELIESKEDCFKKIEIFERAASFLNSEISLIEEYIPYNFHNALQSEYLGFIEEIESLKDHVGNRYIFLGNC